MDYIEKEMAKRKVVTDDPDSSLSKYVEILHHLTMSCVLWQLRGEDKSALPSP